MNIESNNPIAFHTDNITPSSENIFVNEKYKLILLDGNSGNDNHNCPIFAFFKFYKNYEIHLIQQ